MLIGCKTTSKTVPRAVEEYQNEISVPDGMPRNAIRIKGTVLTDAQVSNNRYLYDLKVEEILGYGRNFNAVEPKIGQVIELITPIEVKLAKTDQPTLDVSFLNTSANNKLVFNLLRKVNNE